MLVNFVNCLCILLLVIWIIEIICSKLDDEVVILEVMIVLSCVVEIGFWVKVWIEWWLSMVLIIGFMWFF